MEEKKRHRREERGFFWHWQNLKEHSSQGWLNGRAWLHRRAGGEFGVQWVVPTRSFHLDLTIGGHHQITWSVACLLFALYIHFEGWPWLRKWKAADDWHGRTVDFAIHSWSIWWHIWTIEDEWHATTPKWRDGCFHIDDFFLGKNKYSTRELSTVQAVVPLPEGEYPVTVIFSEQTWKRPRWPWPRVRRGANVESDEGLPTPGKGENSWDLGEDAYTSIGSSATTVEGAIADAIKSVNQRRKRYGGENWRPEEGRYGTNTKKES